MVPGVCVVPVVPLVPVVPVVGMLPLVPMYQLRKKLSFAQKFPKFAKSYPKSVQKMAQNNLLRTFFDNALRIR